ncbi:MAG: hypothetical protein KGI67_14125 [Pseudomonadota bacterium]|nr:hypothetical protein [Pseudomonadota bacterium]
MQQVLIAIAVSWASWQLFSNLAPWQQRRLRAALARRLDGRLPAALVHYLRPQAPRLGCGCAQGCTGLRGASDGSSG